MRGRHGSWGQSLAQAGAAGLAGWLAMLSWRGFSATPARFLIPLFFAAVLLAVSGALLRWLRVPGPLVVLAQVALGAAYVSVVVSGSPLPTGPRWDAMSTAFAEAVTSSQTYAAPVPAPAASIAPLMVAVGVGALVLVDLFACTLRRVPLAGLPLLAVYTIAVSVLSGQVPWWTFALGAAGFLLLLFLQEDEQVGRWGRGLGQDPAGSDPAGFGVRTGNVRTSAMGMAAGATALAVVVPLVVPTLSLGVFGNGPGSGGNEVQIENPVADLRRDLRRGDDVPFVQVRTDDPDPSYLRIAVLNRFTNNEWSSGDRDIPQAQQASGTMPTLSGVSPRVTRREYSYQIDINDGFSSRWLPTMPPLATIEATGDWRYDLETMDFLAADDETDTAGLSYALTGYQLELNATTLAAAPSALGAVDEQFTSLPDTLPREVREIAAQVALDQPTRFQQAVALQTWFRRTGGFRYDLATAEPENGTDALLAFLDGKVGYCEQFASAMAVMARTLGIPARVAIGFLAPDRVGPQTFEYSAWDMHAWPELYFPGSGWVRFEPTPGTRATTTPGYTNQSLPTLPEASVSASPGAEPSDLLPDRATSEPSPEAAVADSAESGGVAGLLPWGRVLAAVLVLFLLVGLGLVPRSVRRWRRSRRWAGAAGPEVAWSELRDTVVDLGHAWPQGRSPRATGELVAGLFGSPDDEDDTLLRPRRGAQLAPEAVESLERIVRAVEIGRYARALGAEGEAHDEVDLQADVERCEAALAAGVTTAARRRASWWPRSAFQRSGPIPAGQADTDREDALVDHVR
jgi:transglutaminase-like putative cysteine protease